MKKFKIILVITLLFTTGCFDFDILHYIEPKKDKLLFIKFRATSVYFKNETKNFSSNKEELQKNLALNRISNLNYQFIENDLTAGIEMTMLAKPFESIPAGDTIFPIIPYRDKYGQFIFIFHNYQEFRSSNDLFDSQQIAEGLLAASKYRFVFGNTIPKKALIIVNRAKPQKFNLSIYQIGNIYCIDIPMNLIIMNDSVVIVSCRSIINDSEIDNYLAKLLEKRKKEEEKKYEELYKNENFDQNNHTDNNEENNNQLDDNTDTTIDTDTDTDTDNDNDTTIENVE
ncbi:MAG: hypothetical protein WBK20_00770 [Spirochaetota bacterium]